MSKIAARIKKLFDFLVLLAAAFVLTVFGIWTALVTRLFVEFLMGANCK